MAKSKPAAASRKPAESRIDLPFRTTGSDGVRKNWDVPAFDESMYPEACALGAEFARAYAKHLADNPDVVGMPLLSDIVRAMDFSDESRKGVCVGFCSMLESLVHASTYHDYHKQKL